MASYHLSCSNISRGQGRSATAAAAYRAATRIEDTRTGESFDFRRKKGVLFTETTAPDGAALDAATLWNGAEAAEKKKNARTAREWEGALPAELDAEAQKKLAQDFARAVQTRYGVAATLAIHAPNRQGDQRNFHFHLLTTTREYKNGELGSKTRILDDKVTGGQEIEAVRQLWQDQCNRALEEAGSAARVSCKSLAAQGRKDAPTIHIGPTAMTMERKGKKTLRGNINRQIKAQRQARREILLEIKRIKEEQQQLELENIKESKDNKEQNLIAYNSQMFDIMGKYNEESPRTAIEAQKMARRVALRLRAIGLEKEDVQAIIETGLAHTGTQDADIQAEGIAEYAFSEHGTAALQGPREQVQEWRILHEQARDAHDTPSNLYTRPAEDTADQDRHGARMK